MKTILPVLAILVAGALTALEGASNGWVAKASGSLFLAMAAAFAVSAGLLLAAAAVVPMKPDWVGAASLPWYAWLGGIYTLATITLAAWATPKLGAGPALVAALLAQTTLGIVLDHFGVLGLERHPATWLKVGGVAVMLLGAGMIAIRP